MFHSAVPRANEKQRRSDEAILAPLIQLVDPASGQLRGPFKPNDILSKIDRKEYVLVQVTEGAFAKGDSKANVKQEWSLHELPICRLLSKRLEYARQRDKKKTPTQSQPKVLQLSWSVTGNDLTHKIAKTRRDLERGHKVRVVILSKKGTRRALPGSQEDERRTDMVQQLLTDLCAPTPDSKQPIARVNSDPTWKNARSLVEFMLDGISSSSSS